MFSRGTAKEGETLKWQVSRTKNIEEVHEGLVNEMVLFVYVCVPQRQDLGVSHTLRAWCRTTVAMPRRLLDGLPWSTVI